MEKNLRMIIEQVKEDTLDHEETKRYILAIKKPLRKIFDSCKDEQEKEEIIQDFLEEYKRDLEFRGNISDIFQRMLMFNTYKRILNIYKGNKSEFESVIKEARRRESENRTEGLSIEMDLKESMISGIRYIIRTKNSTNETNIIQFIQKEKSDKAKELKDRMIRIIQFCVANLEEYGIIDEYIKASNTELEELGLSRLKYLKRNPIADEQYGKNGILLQDAEDIGVMDTFSTENLEKMSVEELEIMTAFWESKYFQERLGLEKALSTIKTLDLWDVILYEDDEAIQNLDNEKVISALKKDLAVTYVCEEKETSITSKMRIQYNKFLDENGISSDVNLDDEVQALLPEMLNLEELAKDINILACLIVSQLNSKDIKIKRWGTIQDNDNKLKDEERIIVIAVESEKFRGPLIIEVSKSLLKNFFLIEELELPKYEGKLDETYCSIMSKLYLPSNKFFTKSVKKSFEENPGSKFLANLAGKKVKEER